MFSLDENAKTTEWQVKKIAVVGPGIVGVPMAALLAYARIREGCDQPAEVVVIQRNSLTSGWKVDAINSGHSPIGGVEPELDHLIADTVSDGILRASHDYDEVRDADVILICVQTDKKGFEPDYGPLFESLNGIAKALRDKPPGHLPLIIVESTLAPSTMATLVKEHFASFGLQEGRDILLGNSPNRVMPGRLVERVAASDKVVGGLSPQTPELIKRIYSKVVTSGTLHCTNSLTAEVIKTLENAYRDVRIAYATEIVRYCDETDIDFYQVRQAVNDRLAQTDGASTDPNCVPAGGILIPTIGVGGHCLPKDGILLWWRRLSTGGDTSGSLILASRQINDESPRETIRLAEKHWGDLSGKSVALMGAAYRFNSEDTRNSPTLALALQLLEKKCAISIHDPFVKPHDQNLQKFHLQEYFSQDFEKSVATAQYLVFCTAHRVYAESRDHIIGLSKSIRGVLDGCNLYRPSDFNGASLSYVGIGRGRQSPPPEFVDFVYQGFRVVECGVANELKELIDFLNDSYADSKFNRIDFSEVQRIAGTCVTGCAIADPAAIQVSPSFAGFTPRLVQCARNGDLAGPTFPK